jgi:hypothetical protein
MEEKTIWWRGDIKCPRYFVLDEEAGLLVGLCLAEGSCGSNGAAIVQMSL